MGGPDYLHDNVAAYYRHIHPEAKGGTCKSQGNKNY